MAMSTADKAKVIQDYQRAPGDTGSPEAQGALLTARILHLSAHLAPRTPPTPHPGGLVPQQKGPHPPRRGLVGMVNSRRKLLDYLKGKDLDRYRALIGRLGLRR